MDLRYIIALKGRAVPEHSVHSSSIVQCSITFCSRKYSYPGGTATT